MNSVMPVPEIIVFAASDAYRADPKILKDALVQLSGIDGVQSSYIGYEFEEPTNVIWVIVYDTYEAHRSFVASDAFSKFLAACKPALASKPEPIHIKITTDPAKSISAPVTEFAYITLKPGQKMDDLAALISRLAQAINVAEGVHESNWGVSIQKDDLYVGIIGWDNEEAHWNAVAVGTPCHAIITKIRGIADISLKHVALGKFSE
jgi:quinol monooxygenase YgiN